MPELRTALERIREPYERLDARITATRTIERLTFGAVKPDVALPLLAAWETPIGPGRAATVGGAAVRGGRLVPEPAKAVGGRTGRAGRAAVDRPTESAL